MRAFNWDDGPFGEYAPALRIVKRVDAQMLAFVIREHDGGRIAMHNETNACRGSAQEIMKFQIRHYLVGQVENELKLVLHSLRHEEVHSSVYCQSNMLRHQTEETNFLFIVSIRIGPAQAQHPQAARSSGQRQCARRRNAELGKEASVSLESRFSAPVGCNQNSTGLLHAWDGGIVKMKRALGGSVYLFTIYREERPAGCVRISVKCKPRAENRTG